MGGERRGGLGYERGEMGNESVERRIERGEWRVENGGEWTGVVSGERKRVESEAE